LNGEFFNNENFRNKTGMDPVGIFGLLNISTQQMTLDATKPQFLASFFATELRRSAQVGYIATAKGTNEFGGEVNSDSAYLKGVANIISVNNPKSTDYMFRDILSNLFSRKVILPSGERATNWVGMVNGVRIPKESAKDSSGNPLDILLPAPLFNHEAQVFSQQGIKFGDGTGGVQEGMALIRGENEIKDMLLALAAQSQLAPWGGAYGGSDVFERMKRERAQLAGILTAGAVSAKAKDASMFVLSLYDEIIASEFKPL
jgi:hypothetical protein